MLLAHSCGRRPLPIPRPRSSSSPLSEGGYRGVPGRAQAPGQEPPPTPPWEGGEELIWGEGRRAPGDDRMAAILPSPHPNPPPQGGRGLLRGERPGERALRGAAWAFAALAWMI